MTEDRRRTVKTFEVELANLIGVVSANLDDVIAKNPNLPMAARASLVRMSWRLMPMTDAAAIRVMRLAYEPEGHSPESSPEGRSPAGMPS